MKILHIYKDFYPPVKGGIEGHINALSKRLVKKGHDVEILVSNTDLKLVCREIDGLKVTKVPQLGRFYSAPLNYSLPIWIKKHGVSVDIIHFHLPNPTATIAYQISGLKKPVVATYHADITRQKRLNLLYGNSLKHFLSNTDKIIATSRNYVATSPILRPFSSKCDVIPLGIDPNRFALTKNIICRRRRIRSLFNKPIILFIGKFRQYKGLPVLIEAMDDVDAVLLIIGGGPAESILKESVRSRGLTNRVFFLGELPDDDVNAHLHACDIFTLPATQRSEAFGIVQLEAMACGKPVVSTELGTGTSFVNRHGKTGIVVAPGDAKSLSRALNELVDSPSKRERLGRNGRERMRKRFCLDRMVEETIKTYSSVLSSPGI